MSKIIFIVPARSGSKGLPEKNLQKIGEKALVRIALETAVNVAKDFEQTKIILSTDSDLIARETAGLGVDIHERSEASSSDTASAADLLAEMITCYSWELEEVICYLQPTSPLRMESDVRSCLQLALSLEGPVVSVVDPNFHPMKSLLVQPNDRLEEFVATAPTANRQMLPRMVNPNGAVYVFRVGEFVVHGAVPINGAIAYQMPFLRSLDIDSAGDLDLIRKLVIANVV